MFWTDWGSPGKIERAYMDGSGRTTIADTNLVWPNDITIDYDVRKNIPTLYVTGTGKRAQFAQIHVLLLSYRQKCNK